MPIAKFAYNNIQNTITVYIFFKLNYGYYLHVFFKKNFNSFFKSKSADKLLVDQKELIIIYRKKPYHFQKLQR